MFTDADLSAPMEEAERLFAALDAGADVAIGSRWLDRQKQTLHQPLYRRFFGRCFNAVTRRAERPDRRMLTVGGRAPAPRAGDDPPGRPRRSMG